MEDLWGYTAVRVPFVREGPDWYGRGGMLLGTLGFAARHCKAHMLWGSRPDHNLNHIAA